MQADDTRDEPRNVLPDLVIPVLAVGFTAYYLSTITHVPWIAQASAVTVSVLLLAAIAAWAARTVYHIRRGRERLALAAPAMDARVSARRAALLLLSVAYVAVIDTLGFTLTTLAFVFLGIVLLSSLANWRRAALVAAFSAVAGYVVFIHFFETRFPRGPVENALRGLF